MDECKPLPGGLRGAGPPPRRRARAGCQGRAVQVDPIKPTLKPTGNKRLKLKYDNMLSNFAFDLSLHRYTKAKL